MITDSSTDNAGLNYIPFIIYNLNTNESQHLNIYDKTFGERINTFSSIVYSHKINTLFLIPNKHKTIVYYNIIENSLGEVLLFDSITNQNLGSEFLYQETEQNQGSSLFSDAKIIDDITFNLYPHNFWSLMKPSPKVPEKPSANIIPISVRLPSIS